MTDANDKLTNLSTYTRAVRHQVSRWRTLWRITETDAACLVAEEKACRWANHLEGRS